MELIGKFSVTIGSTIRDVFPIVAIAVGFQVFIIRESVRRPRQIVIGFVFVILGLAVFLAGLQMALFPLGRLLASELTQFTLLPGGPETVVSSPAWYHYTWVYVFACAIGFSTTIAEPSLLAVAIKAEEVSGGAIRSWGLRVAVAIGVAVGVALGTYRIVAGTPLHYYIIAGYAIVMLQTVYAPKIIVALAYDSGGVTTSTVTVPVVAALGLGLANAVPGRSAIIDGFGLIAFASVFPIMTVLAYAQISQWRKRTRSRVSERG